MMPEKFFRSYSLLAMILCVAISCQSQRLGVNVKASSVRVDPTPTVTPPPVATFELLERPEQIISRPLPSDGAELIYVPAGDFVMGSPYLSTDAENDEYPSHFVHLDGFWIHKTEVTNKMYSDCVRTGPCNAPEIEAEDFATHPYNFADKADHPVTDVKWSQAATYCEWINGRLPTEAEWEKTARGTQPLLYPWGGFEPNCGFANLDDCEDGTSEVGQYSHGQSPYNALDMAGNVREWVYDLYSPDTYKISSYHNPPGVRNGENRVARGGGWQDGPGDLRTANRFELDPETSEPDLGFRCVVLNQSAPMCQLNYQPLCAPGSLGSPDFQPGRPGRKCVPDGGLDPEKIVVQFGCVGPSVQEMNVNLRSKLSGTELIKLNGLEYDCETNDEYPGRLFCKGPSALQGEANAVSVCRGGCTPNPCPSNYIFDEKQDTCLPPVVDMGIECEDGSYFDARTESCLPLEPSSRFGICAQGYSNENGLSYCSPDSGNSENQDCPEGTFFDSNSEQCVSEENDCISGFYFDPYTDQCRPTTFSNLSCPAGSYLNPAVNCCVPYDSEMGCLQGYTFDTRVMSCIPEPEDGHCPKGYAYEAEDDACRSTVEETILCPPNYIYDKGMESCQPTNSEYADPSRDCPEGSVIDQHSGSCVPVHTKTGQDDCADGYYLDITSERCISTRNGCPLGTYFDSKSEQCIPTAGLTSGCPSGTYYSDWYACCAPSNDFGRQGCPQGFYFDSGLGYCTPPPAENGYCGESFHFDTITARCIANRNPSDTTPCPADLVFDIELGYCIPHPNENGDCDVDFTFDAESERCVFNDPSNLGCPIGYFFDPLHEQCAPGDPGASTSLSCVSIIAQAPHCSSSAP